jgi:ethanolamine-phosphate cytidylyltransferase
MEKLHERVITALKNLDDTQATKVAEFAESLAKEKKEREVIYIDGGFDLLHAGHYNAIRQAKALGDELVVGTNSDADLLQVKGPTIFNGKERAEIVRHCKFVSTVHPDTDYTPTPELLDRIGCTAYAHGDDPCYNAAGEDICEPFRQLGRMRVFKRTEGVSTTDTTARLL